MTILADIKQTVRVVDKDTYTEDEYGTKTLTGSTVYLPDAYITFLTSNDEVVKSGVLNTGDARGYFAASGSILKPGQIVEFRNRQFEIAGEPFVGDIGGAVIHYEVNLKRLHKP